MEPPPFEGVNATTAGPSTDNPPPPAYQEQRDDPDEVLQPAILLLGDRFIYHESLHSSPLYQLSRTIHAQGMAANKIELERLDHRVKNLSDGSPSVATRRKHIYNLQHYSVMFSSDLSCGIESVSRKGLGTVAINKRPFPHSGYYAMRVPSDAEKGKKIDKNDYLFLIKEKKDVFEWADQTGKVVASQDYREGQHMLLVALPLSRRMMDGLVALWCLWMWHAHVEGIKEPKSWGDVKRQLQRPRERIWGQVVQ